MQIRRRRHNGVAFLARQRMSLSGKIEAIQPDTGPTDFRIGILAHDVSRLRKTLFDRGMRAPRHHTLTVEGPRSTVARGPFGGKLQTELALWRGLRFRLPLCGTGSATSITGAGCQYERTAAALPLRSQRSAGNRLGRSQSDRQHRHDAARRRERADQSNSFPGPQSVEHVLVPVQLRGE
jgi:hypothetical protein